MVSIRYLCGVGEVRRTKSIPRRGFTSKMGATEASARQFKKLRRVNRRTITKNRLLVLKRRNAQRSAQAKANTVKPKCRKAESDEIGKEPQTCHGRAWPHPPWQLARVRRRTSVRTG